MKRLLPFRRELPISMEPIEDDPENIEARIVRVGNSLELPENFKRLEKVDEDFNLLFKMIKKDRVKFSQYIDPGIIFLYKAKYLQMEGKINQALRFAKVGIKMSNGEGNG